MKIGNSYVLNQSFKANSNEHKRSFMGDISDAIDSTADFMKVAKTAIDSPEEASVKLVTDQIDNVAKSEKTPNWAKTGLKFVSAGLTAGLTGYAAYKAPRGFKNLLSKFKLGRSVLNLAASAKENIGGLLKKIKFDSKILNSAKTKVVNGLSAIKNFLTGKFPKITEKVRAGKAKLHTDKWTKSGVIKTAIASALGLSSGKKVLDKYDNIIKDSKDADDDIEVRDAA